MPPQARGSRRIQRGEHALCRVLAGGSAERGLEEVPRIGMIPQDVGYLVASEPTAADECFWHLVSVCLQQEASRLLVKVLPGKHGQSDLPCLEPRRCRDLPLSFGRKGIQPGEVV
jgi:hypothetical protein